MIFDKEMDQHMPALPSTATAIPPVASRTMTLSHMDQFGFANAVPLRQPAGLSLCPAFSPETLEALLATFDVSADYGLDVDTAVAAASPIATAAVPPPVAAIPPVAAASSVSAAAAAESPQVSLDLDFGSGCLTSAPPPPAALAVAASVAPASAAAAGIDMATLAERELARMPSFLGVHSAGVGGGEDGSNSPKAPSPPRSRRRLSDAE